MIINRVNIRANVFYFDYVKLNIYLGIVGIMHIFLKVGLLEARR